MLEFKIHHDDAEVVLKFEHSLLSLSKWESRNKIPFLTRDAKPISEMVEYFQDMLLTEIDPSVVYGLSPDQLEQLQNHVNDSLTASVVPKDTKTKGVPEITTSELIYFWMTALEIDWRAESWHLSRLMTLIEITSFKKQPEKPVDKAQALRDWQSINESNQKKLGITEA